MLPIAPIECGSPLETSPDADRDLESARSEGVFCCPECGTRLHLTQRSAVERAVPRVRSNESPNIDPIFNTLPAEPTGESAKQAEVDHGCMVSKLNGLLSPQGHSGFFGVLSNLVVDWEVTDSDAPSRVRCKLDPEGIPANGTVDPRDDLVDIDWLLESAFRLANEDPSEVLEPQEAPAPTTLSAHLDSLPPVDVTPRTTTSDFSALGIDLSDLDISVFPFAVVDDPSDEKAAATTPENLTMEPLVGDVSSRPRRRSTGRLVWLSLGIALVGGFATLMHHKVRMADAERVSSSSDRVANATAPMAQVVHSPSVNATTETEPLPAAPRAEELALEDDSGRTTLAKPVTKPPQLADSAQESQSATSATSSPEQFEDQTQPGPGFTPASESESEPMLAAFDAEAAASALEQAAERASACRQAGEPSGMAVVSVTFASSGRVTTAKILAPPFKGTATGSCVASTMRSVRVPAFAGTFETVAKLITIR